MINSVHVKIAMSRLSTQRFSALDGTGEPKFTVSVTIAGSSRMHILALLKKHLPPPHSNRKYT